MTSMPNRRHWPLALFLSIVALGVYFVIAGRTVRYPSIAPYYLQLAAALAHGQAYIEPSVNTGYDLIHNGERWYVAQQPLPALLMMPLAVVVGIEHVSDTAIQILIGGLNVALCSLTLSWYLPDLQRWLPALFYHNTGAAQFGYRFLLDAMPLFVLLVAAASQRLAPLVLIPLLVYSIVINLWSAG